MGELEKILQKRWDSCCRILFRQELGPIEDYVPWLTALNPPILHRKSSLSGKPVSFAIGEYCDGGKLMGFEEIDFSEKPPSLSINEIKDIDSLIGSVSDRFYYAGDVILGNSGFVEKSSNIADSFYMLETGKLADSRYIGYSYIGRLGSDCFGCNGIGESQHTIRCYETYRDKRCFELWMSQNSSDCYYSHGLDSCIDCMFSFHLKNKRHAIGNLELEPSKYSSLKGKLLEEMVDTLRSKKSLPSLVDVANRCKVLSPPLEAQPAAEPEKADKKAIEKAFASTSQLLFGKPLPGGIDAYAGWLSRNTAKQDSNPSAFSGKMVRRSHYCGYSELPVKRIISKEEAQDLGNTLKIDAASLEGFSLASASGKIGKIAFFTSEYWEGTHFNLIECATSSSSANCYRSAPVIYAKNCGYSFWPRSTEHAFGCGALLSSEFCINCYQSVKLKRCFEMDSCRDCADSYFCHNAENCHDCMFSFNVKNLKFAIGNAEVGREKFMEAKVALLKWINSSLEKTHDLKTDIYNVGCAKNKR